MFQKGKIQPSAKLNYLDNPPFLDGPNGLPIGGRTFQPTSYLLSRKYTNWATTLAHEMSLPMHWRTNRFLTNRINCELICSMLVPAFSLYATKGVTLCYIPCVTFSLAWIDSKLSLVSCGEGASGAIYGTSFLDASLLSGGEKRLCCLNNSIPPTSFSSSKSVRSKGTFSSR